MAGALYIPPLTVLFVTCSCAQEHCMLFPVKGQRGPLFGGLKLDPISGENKMSPVSFVSIGFS
jgi:hypothetical protein